MTSTKIKAYQVFIEGEKSNVIVAGETYKHKAKYKYLSSELGAEIREEDVTLRLATPQEINDSEHVV